MNPRLRTLLVTALAAALLGAEATAAAQPRSPPGASTSSSTVLAIDSGDLVIDVGRDKGAHDGQVVELWRPMRMRHPVTGQILTDRFRIGSARLSQVQATLSLAKPDGEFLRPPATGDIVIVPNDGTRQAPEPTKAAETPKTSTREPPPSGTSTTRVVPADPDALALSDLFVALQGADPATRIRAYESFVKAHPKSRFATVLREEIDALRSGKREEPPYETSFAPLDRVQPAVAQRFAVELDTRFVGAVVHVRRKGQPTYRSLPMETIGARYWAATLPGDALADPGMEYFVEGVNAAGTSVAVIGSAEDPRRAEVDPYPFVGREPGTLVQLNTWSEYASFNAKRANDYVFQTEGNAGWRLGDEGIRAIRSGFGVIRGKGGSVRDLDELGIPPRNIGLTYGYIETEFGITQTFGLIGRPIIGLRERGITGGAQGFFRIGSDLRTNLLIGGEILGSVGLRGVVQLDWRTIKHVPIMLRSEVTNQPAGDAGDVGARAIAQIGYELLNGLTLSARLSYQGRTINHAGPGAGAAVGYEW